MKNTHKFKIFVHLIIVSYLIILISGCDPSAIGFTVPIKNLLDNPRDYDSKTITIEGKVTDVMSLLVIKAFAIRDNTGEIIVVTERILPKKGDTVKVRGRIVEAFSFGDQSITAFQEWSE